MKLYFFWFLNACTSNKTQSSFQSIANTGLWSGIYSQVLLITDTYLCTQPILRMTHSGAKQTLQEWDATTFLMSRERNSVAFKGRQMKEVRWPARPY